MILKMTKNMRFCLQNILQKNGKTTNTELKTWQKCGRTD
jgi:hypothetical protein